MGERQKTIQCEKCPGCRCAIWLDLKDPKPNTSNAGLLDWFANKAKSDTYYPHDRQDAMNKYANELLPGNPDLQDLLIAALKLRSKFPKDVTNSPVEHSELIIGLNKQFQPKNGYLIKKLKQKPTIDEYEQFVSVYYNIVIGWGGKELLRSDYKEGLILSFICHNIWNSPTLGKNDINELELDRPKKRRSRSPEFRKFANSHLPGQNNLQDILFFMYGVRKDIKRQNIKKEKAVKIIEELVVNENFSALSPEEMKRIIYLAEKYTLAIFLTSQKRDKTSEELENLVEEKSKINSDTIARILFDDLGIDIDQ